MLMRACHALFDDAARTIRRHRPYDKSLMLIEGGRLRDFAGSKIPVITPTKDDDNGAAGEDGIDVVSASTGDVTGDVDGGDGDGENAASADGASNDSGATANATTIVKKAGIMYDHLLKRQAQVWKYNIRFSKWKKLLPSVFKLNTADAKERRKAKEERNKKKKKGKKEKPKPKPKSKQDVQKEGKRYAPETLTLANSWMHTSVAKSDSALLFVFGGGCPPSFLNGTRWVSRCSSELWQFVHADIGHRNVLPYWRLLEPVEDSKIPLGRVQHAAAIVGRHLYIHGGNCGDTILAEGPSVWRINIDQLKWEQVYPETIVGSKAPGSRWGHAAASYNDEGFFIFGGCIGNGGSYVKHTNELWWFDTKENQWTWLKPKVANAAVAMSASKTAQRPLNMPSPRAHSSVVVHNNWIVVVGGTNGVEYFGDVWAYRMGTRVWSRFHLLVPSSENTVLEPAWFYNSVAVIKETMYIAASDTVASPLNKLYSINLAILRDVSGNDMPHYSKRSVVELNVLTENLLSRVETTEKDLLTRTSSFIAEKQTLADRQVFQIYQKTLVKSTTSNIRRHDLHALKGVTAINGGVLIADDADIKDLSFLSSVERIEGDLAITRNAKLASLDGLQNLKHVGGHVLIHDNIKLVDLKGFRGLQKVVGKLSVTACNLVTSLEGLFNIRETGGITVLSSLAVQCPADKHVETMVGLEDFGRTIKIRCLLDGEGIIISGTSPDMSYIKEDNLEFAINQHNFGGREGKAKVLAQQNAAMAKLQQAQLAGKAASAAERNLAAPPSPPPVRTTAGGAALLDRLAKITTEQTFAEKGSNEAGERD